MKINAMRAWTAVGLSALVSTAAVRAFADEVATSTKQDKTYTGTVTAVDPQERVLHVKGLMFTKKFNLGDSCKYTLLDNSAGSINDLRPGQRITVHYQNAQGVLAASRVEQNPMRFEGTVKTMDADKHLMTVT